MAVMNVMALVAVREVNVNRHHLNGHFPILAALTFMVSSRWYPLVMDPEST